MKRQFWFSLEKNVNSMRFSIFADIIFLHLYKKGKQRKIKTSKEIYEHEMQFS